MRRAATDREGLNGVKLRHFMNVMLSGKTRAADAYLGNFADFDVRQLEMLTRKKIGHILLDIDGCIAPPYGPIRDENLGHIANMKLTGIGVGVYSNCQDMPRLDPLRAMDVPIYGGMIAKPAAEGFLAACQSMGFDPETTWMVGDNPLTDGGAVGVLGGVAFVKPLDVDSHYVPGKKLVPLALAGILREMALVRTLLDNTKIHRVLATPYPY